MWDFAPSGDCDGGRLRGGLIGEEHLRYSDSRMRAEFRAARVECGGETRRRNCDLRRKRPRVKIDIAQELGFSARIVALENLDDPASQFAVFSGLVGEVRQASGQSCDEQK